jgi:hypothetical protein
MPSDLAQLLWKSVRRFPKKLKVELPYDPAIPLLGIHPKDSQSAYNRDTCTTMCITEALFTIAKLHNQLRCIATNKYIKKTEYIYHKDQHCIIYRKMDETRDQYVKQNKPDS